MHTCSVFKGWMYMYAEMSSFTRKFVLCINCVGKGHIAEKCRAPPICKKCTKSDHTLLHRVVDSVPQEKPKKDDKVEETHIAALTLSEQVLLMTCKVKVTTADLTN